MKTCKDKFFNDYIKHIKKKMRDDVGFVKTTVTSNRKKYDRRRDKKQLEKL